jgi:hypothetical protein
MSDIDNEVPSCRSGCVTPPLTPPLSPTKTVSTEGWFSPRTPGSPRKTRSCLFTREIDTDVESFFFSPPASPTKSKSTIEHCALTIPKIFHAVNEPTPSEFDHDSPAKHHVPVIPSRLNAFLPPTIARIHSPLTTNTYECSHEDPCLLPAAISNVSSVNERLPMTRKSSHRSFSDSLATIPVTTPLPTQSCPDTITRDAERLVSLSSNVTNVGEDNPSPTRLRPFPLRCASSPLRSSQRAARGGALQSTRRGQACTLDRYIASRRPPTVTRESFELNNLAKRLENAQFSRGGRPGADPFSRRLRRSGRLDDELQNLREAHSLIIGRTSAQRRNATLAYRRNSSISDIRQISAGAVWNVGGSSAVSDTVIGVSTGSGGMLGSGTNAPLYKSSFLNRADPEAELEAYEHRLALALDCDQTDRILQYSPSSSGYRNERHGGTTPYAKHTWRDGAWIKDGFVPCLFNAVPRHICSSC